jgi:hypothetical protein
MLTLDDIELAAGAHENAQAGMCAMEAAAYIAGEPFSDHPACVCPTIATFTRSWNDSLDDATRQRLKLYIPRMIGTAGDGNEIRRAWLCMDWLTRECTPTWLDLAKLNNHAAALRDLPEITDKASLRVATPTAQKASDAAWAARAAARAAAWDAAGDAAWDAAWDAARDAAWAAARDAARDAAGDAAWAAARDAAGDAARDAARDAILPTTKRLQESAFALLDRMLSL